MAGTTRLRMQKRKQRVGTSHCVALPRAKWRSWLNGNGRWFVRQSSFSGFARRSFSRQLRGEKEIGERRGTSCSPVFRLVSAFRVLFYTCPISVSLFLPRSSSLFRLHSAATRHMDAHEELASSAAREKGLGNLLRDSLPSLNE